MNTSTILHTYFDNLGYATYYNSYICIICLCTLVFLVECIDFIVNINRLNNTKTSKTNGKKKSHFKKLKSNKLPVTLNLNVQVTLIDKETDSLKLNTILSKYKIIEGVTVTESEV